MAKIWFDQASPSEVSLISSTTRSQPGLVFRSPATLLTSLKRNCLYVCRSEKSKLLAWMEAYPLTQSYWGISTLFVQPQWRKQGIATRLLTHVVSQLSSHHLFTASANPRIYPVLTRLGFVAVPITKIPAAVLITFLLQRYRDPRSLLSLLSVSKAAMTYFYRPIQAP